MKRITNAPNFKSAKFNFKTFREDKYAGYYAAGVGLFYGASKEFWNLWVFEVTPNSDGIVEKMSLSDDLIVPILIGTSFVIFLGGCGLWMGETCRIGKGRFRMYARLIILCVFMNSLLVTALEETSMLIDCFAMSTIGIVGASLLYRGKINLLKTKR